MDSTKVAPTINELGVKLNVESLSLGRNVYINKCTKCHNALRITRYSQERWDEILPEMIEKTNLSVNEANSVTSYIQAVLSASTTSPSTKSSHPK